MEHLMDTITTFLPLLEFVFAMAIVPLIKNLATLNTTLEKLVQRIDFLEKDITRQQDRIEKQIATIEAKFDSLDKRMDEHIVNKHTV